MAESDFNEKVMAPLLAGLIALVLVAALSAVTIAVKHIDAKPAAVRLAVR